MTKEDLRALLVSKKDEKLASVAADFDLLISAVDQLEMPDVAALQAEIAELKSKLGQADSLAKQIDALLPDA